MESKNLISEQLTKSNNFRDEAFKAFSPPKIYNPELKSKNETQFKTINNYSKEIFISSKIKDMSILNQAKPKILKGTLPPVFNIVEKRNSSCDKKNNSEKNINISNKKIDLERKDGSPLLKINEYASNTEQKGFKNYNPKINNYFREKTMSPPLNQYQKVHDISKNSDIFVISEVNANDIGEEIDSKNKTYFSDFETKTLIRNKTVTTNFSTVGFGIVNENNFNDNNSKFNAWNGANNNNINNINNKINKNQVISLYQKQLFLNNNDNKKYDNIYIENKNKKTINNDNKNQGINKINININEKILFKKSPSETHENNTKTIESMKADILNNKYNRKKRINTNMNQNEEEETSNNKYYSHDNKKIRKNIDKKINKQINLNEGISYNILNGYKYHFNVSNVDIYLLKEINNKFIKKLIEPIKKWRNKYNEESIFLKIIDIKINTPEGCSTIIIEHPIGGENFTNFINSIGFNNENLLFKIISEIYKYILIFQKNNYFRNIPFCICDIFIDINERIKIIPPIIRYISFLCNNQNHKDKEKCICKYYFEKIKNIYEINTNYISIFCLGFSIIQLITQNLIFKMKSFSILLSHKNNTDLKKCCLVHTLQNIETLFCNNKEDLLLSNFLELYPKYLTEFLHECIDFNGRSPNESYQILNRKSNNNTNENSIKVKELLKLVELPKNTYCKFEKFLENFEILYKNFNIMPDLFNYSLKKKKILSNLSRAFNIEKLEGIKTFLQIIKNNDEKYY